MTPRRSRLVTGALIVFGTIIGVTVGLQLRVYSFAPGTNATPQQRQALFEMLQPVVLSNCQLERFGEAHDGGYLMCGNLLNGAQAAYSYGISGYDQWGCDVSTRLAVLVENASLYHDVNARRERWEAVFRLGLVW